MDAVSYTHLDVYKRQDKDEWEWHGDWNMGDAGFPIIGYDVNNDGKTDIIYGHGHSYGLYWLEQTGEGANRTWVKHTIDESYSQVHALKMVDLDGDCLLYTSRCV